MTREALVGIVSRAQSIRVRMELGKHRIEFAQASDLRAIRDLSTVVTSGLKLARSQDPFQKGSKLILVDWLASRRVSADHRRMWDRDPLLLQSAAGVLNAAAYSGISLSKYPTGTAKQNTRDCKVLRESSAHLHTLSISS